MQTPARKTSFRVSGFTLVELMISIAIMLLLVAGINLIFSTTTKAVGSGQALSEGARNNQAAQGVMYQDFASCATDDAPFMVIYNHAIPAFRTLADQQGDRDYNPSAGQIARQKAMLTIDLDNDNNEGGSTGETLSPAIYNDRNHRTDIIEFFARDVFKRQTGNDGTYVANEVANEAMIWYGHLNLPNNSGLYPAAPNQVSPGNGSSNGASNPNNFFATQWILGRQAILLTHGLAGVIAADGANQFHVDTTARDWDGAAAINDLTPLQYNSATSNGAAADGTMSMQSSRYDLADTSFADFHGRLKNYLDAAINPGHQMPPLSEYWSYLNCNDATRFNANPSVGKPITSAEFARTAPIFLPACSQFVVEFAGDFVTQDAAGVVAAPPAAPDNTLDYVIDAATGAHKIRWYGMPRNVDTSNDAVTGEVISGAPTSGDVVPVFAVAGAYQTFEHTTLTPAGNFATTAFPIGAEYTCAWGPADTNRPQLIRITYTLDDPASRLGNPLTYEYVFKIK